MAELAWSDVAASFPSDATLRHASAKSLLHAMVRCVYITRHHYCLHIGFTPMKPGTLSFDAYLSNLAKAPESHSDMRTLDVLRLEAAKPAALRRKDERAELAAAALSLVGPS